jgi:serine/threonine protein kinase
VTVTRGTLIAGRYEVSQVLGRGGMGVVYKAHDRLLDETVALKVLRRDLLGASAVAQRFRSEIKLARRVSHPNVCRIHDYGEAGGLSFLAMAFVDGTDVKRQLARHVDGFEPDEAFEIAIQLARGLQAIHDAGIVHRDLKTMNIMRAPDGAVRLMDFGIAKQAADTDSGLTATGSVMGTPEYMSPEQCRGLKVDTRSDLYSLGIVIFELFTGAVPFRGDTVVATLFMHIQEPPPLSGARAHRLPPALVPWLRRLLAKAPGERPSSAGEVALGLEAARAQPRGPVASPAPAPDNANRLGRERRGHSRLDTPLNVVLKRTSAQGALLQEERTVADNLSLRGARVLTSLVSIAVGDVVIFEELGGSFSTRAVVRHRTQGRDNICRLGLEFVERPAPAHLVQTGDWMSHVSAGRATPPGVPRERRTSSRIDAPLEVLITPAAGELSAPPEPERTIAENISMGGARVLTTFKTVAIGDVVHFAEWGGEFRTRAVVRNSYAGRDGIVRLNLHFLDRPAPDRLIPSVAEGGGWTPPAPGGSGVNARVGRERSSRAPN